jgi:restriction endonuclease HindI-like protein
VDSLAKYRNRAIETAQVIEELIAMAKQFKEAALRGEEVNLNDAELAFYDALETNEASVRELGDEILKKIAVELTDNLRKNVSVDWSVRDLGFVIQRLAIFSIISPTVGLALMTRASRAGSAEIKEEFILLMSRIGKHLAEEHGVSF